MKNISDENDDFQIPPEALKKIKSQSELDDFFHGLYKQAVEGMLRAEMDEHLGYQKHQTKEKSGVNSRNGYSNKVLKTNIGDIPLEVPRDRDSSFEPVLVPKHQRMSARIEQAIITLYSRGMSTRDIEATIKEMYGVELIEGTVSNYNSGKIPITFLCKFFSGYKHGQSQFFYTVYSSNIPDNTSYYS